jgi:hypothetical protein
MELSSLLLLFDTDLFLLSAVVVGGRLREVVRRLLLLEPLFIIGVNRSSSPASLYIVDKRLSTLDVRLSKLRMYSESSPIPLEPLDDQCCDDMEELGDIDCPYFIIRFHTNFLCAALTFAYALI